MTSPPMFAWRRNSRSLSSSRTRSWSSRSICAAPPHPSAPPELELALEGLDLEIAPEHLEARVHQMNPVVDRLQLGGLVHNVDRRRHLATVVQQAGDLQLIAVLVAHPEIAEGSIVRLVDGFRQHHR